MGKGSPLLGFESRSVRQTFRGANTLSQRFFLILLGLGLASSSFAQSLSEYVQLRKKWGITQATGVQALETLVGERTLEVSGIVKGSVRIGDAGTLILQSTDGGELHIDADRIPEWLTGNMVSARLLVRARRSDEQGALRASLIGAAAEGDIADLDMKAAKIRAAANPKPLTSRSTVGTKGSRGHRPPPMQGTILTDSVPPPKQVKNWSLPGSDALPYYTAYILKQNKKLSVAQAEKIARGIIGFSIKYGVDARLIMAMVLVESGFNPTSTSKSGAMGLGQLMPGTARGMGVSNAYDSSENLWGTVRLVRGHLEKYNKQTSGDSYQALVLALAAYNAGSGAVRRAGGVPPYRETQNYIKKVITTYNRLSGYAS